MALLVGALIVVATSAAVYVRLQSEQDARQAAGADATFAAQKAAKQLQAAFDEIQALSTPIASDPAIGQLFADPTKCGLGYAPIGQLHADGICARDHVLIGDDDALRVDDDA